MYEFLNTLICGTAAGIANCLSGFPLDTIKTRMQMQQVRFLECISNTFKQGISTFYKGMYYPIVTIPLVNAVSFSSYELYKRLFGQAGDLSFSNGLKAGAFSGVIGSLIVNPVELIKCRMQADHGKYQSSAECLHQVLRNQGLKELYRGMFSTLARELPSMGGQFAAYEIAKDHFLGKKTAKTLTFQESFITGGIAGIGAWVFAYPQDVVKTRLQVHNKEYKKAKWLPDGGFLDCWREIYRENGVKGFFRGILPCFMRAFIANGFMIVAYQRVQLTTKPYFDLPH